MNLNTNDYKNMFDTKFINIRNSVKKQLNKKTVLDNYKNKTIMEELSEFTQNSKLYSHSKQKHNINTGEYLMIENIFKNR